MHCHTYEAPRINLCFVSCHSSSNSLVNSCSDLCNVNINIKLTKVSQTEETRGETAAPLPWKTYSGVRTGRRVPCLKKNLVKIRLLNAENHNTSGLNRARLRLTSNSLVHGTRFQLTYNLQKKNCSTLFAKIWVLRKFVALVARCTFS